MKKTILIIFVLFVVLSLQAQYAHVYKDKDGKLLVDYKLPEANPKKVKKNATGPMHTVTFHFNPSTAWFMVALISEDTAYFEHSSNMCSFTVPEGDYQLCADEVPSMNPCIILDNMHIYSDIDTILSRSSANISLFTELRDEKGSIIYPEESNKDMLGYMVYFKPDAYSPFSVTVASGLPLTVLRSTPIPQGMKLRLARHGVKDGNSYKAYAVNYDILAEITQDTVITNVPEELHHYKLEFNSTPAGREYYMGWGFGSVANSTLLGKTDTFVIGFMDESCPAQKKETVDFYFNHAANDTLIAWFGSNAYHIQDDLNLGGSGLVGSGILFPDTTDDLVMSVKGSYPPVTGDIKVLPGQLTPLVKGPPVNFHWGVSDANSLLIRVYPSYRGIANERRSIDNTYAVYELWRGNELLISDSLKNFETYIGVPAPDQYRLVFKNTNYLINGVPGKQATELIFNLADTVDANAPTPLSFSVLQDNKPTDEIIRGYPASVVLMAADLENLPDRSVYHDLMNAELYYKENSASEWLRLELFPLTGELDSLVGMPYTADLWEVLEATSDTALIDLKLVLTDSAGNSNIQTFSPAFFIRDALVGTTDQPAFNFTLFPNPAHDYCTIEANALQPDESELTILSPTGEVLLVKTLNNPNTSLNLSKYCPGIYLIRLKTMDDVLVKKLVVY